jgi:Na+-driven multidrug efflux pump
LPCILILPRFFGENGVWYSMPISDAIATIVAAVMLWQQFRAFKRIDG